MHTDWNFLNNIQKSFSKEVTQGEVEEYFPALFRNDFNTFYTEDIDFKSFPPLQGQFGDVTINQ